VDPTPTPDPDTTFKEDLALTLDPTLDPDPVSDPATLASASRKLRGNYTNVSVFNLSFIGNFLDGK
jgi:hypothetical protein